MTLRGRFRRWRHARQWKKAGRKEQGPLREERPHHFSLPAIVDVAHTGGEDVVPVHDVGLYRQLDGQFLAALCEPDELADTALEPRAWYQGRQGKAGQFR